MWIKSTNPAHEGGAFKDPHLDEPVEFNGNGRAQVTAEVGDHLVENYEPFERTQDVEASDDADVEADAEANGGEA